MPNNFTTCRGMIICEKCDRVYYFTLNEEWYGRFCKCGEPMTDKLLFYRRYSVESGPVRGTANFTMADRVFLAAAGIQVKGLP